VDAIYMHAVQRLTGGRGGWPMTAWLTADRKPFAGGTYFPKSHFLARLAAEHKTYSETPKRVAELAESAASALRQSIVPPGPPRPGDVGTEVLALAAETYLDRLDSVLGG